MLSKRSVNLNLLVQFLIITIFVSCENEQTKLHEQQAFNNAELYRSSEDSYQKDFFLKVENEIATIYGWYASNENDTIYYRSKNILKEDHLGNISFNLDTFELSKEKVNENNLNDFEAYTKVIKPAVLLKTHNNFQGKVLQNGNLNLSAVKIHYYSKFDKFTFERIR